MRPRELDHEPSLHAGSVAIRACPVAEPLSLHVRQLRRARGRQHESDLGLHLYVAVVELHAGAQLRYTFIEAAHSDAEPRGFKQVGQGGRSEDGPVLAKLHKPWQIADLRVQTRVTEPQRRPGGTHAADISVVHIGEVAFEVVLEPARQGQAGILRHPLEQGSYPETASLYVKLRVGVGARVAQQKGKRKIVIAENRATARRSVFHGAGLE